MQLFVQCKWNRFECSFLFIYILFNSDPRLQNSRLPNEASDTSSRLVNLDFTLRSIRSFVQVGFAIIFFFCLLIFTLGFF